MYRKRVENWLQNASLPAGIPTTLNDQGFWTVTVANAELTLALNEERESLFICASLITLKGDENVDFYRRLLCLQSKAQLPPGIMFGLDEHENILMLFGHLDLKTLDLASFEALLNNVLRTMAFLERKLMDTTHQDTTDTRLVQKTARFQAKDLIPSEEKNTAEFNENEETQGPDSLLGQSLSDEELLKLQMTQSIHF